MDNLIKKLHLIKENPGYYNALSPEEQAELFIFLLTPKKKVFQKPVQIKAIDGITPVKDVDYLSKETTLKTLEEIREQVQKKLDKIQQPEKGKDAVITPKIIDDILGQVLALVEIPEYTPYDDTVLRETLEDIQLDHEELRDEVDALKKNLTTQFVGGGVSANWVKNYVAQQSYEPVVTFETVSHNLDSINATLNYTGGELISMEYANGITKTLNYTGNKLTSVVLSGDTPAGIDLVKTYVYTGDDLTGVEYS
jgi:hypothetical protein